MVTNLAKLVWLKNVTFVNHHKQFFVELLNKFKEGEFRITHGLSGTCYKQYQIATRNEFFCQKLVLSFNRVGTWCVYKVDVPQQWHRQLQSVFVLPFPGLLRVRDDLQLVCGWNDSSFELVGFK
eukprot:Lithocolla_globosa_v1_NODE_2885_length_1835_cov_3.374157.p2 type:complete len:124 gc:universal NODE_2885_length_1835_cov_3.374157:680-309(-)